MSLSPTVHFAKNEVIFREGDIPDGVFLICNGAVDITKHKGKDEVRLARLGEGTIFGEMALIDNVRRSATVTAIEDTWCYQHNNTSFVKKLTELDPEIRDIFQDLVNTIRKKSEASVLIDQGKIQPANIDVSGTPPMPKRSKMDIMGDDDIQEKISGLDFFMRRLFYSLMDIAYR